MTQDDLALMYEKAHGWNPAPYKITMEELERFAQLVAAHEREACAKVCETLLMPTATDFYGKRYAAAIRARGT